MSEKETINQSGTFGTGIVYGNVAPGQMNVGSPVSAPQVSANTLMIHLEALEHAIQQSNSKDSEKKEALGLLQKLTTHPLIVSVLKGAAGSAI
jgi:hypothetical protein